MTSVEKLLADAARANMSIKGTGRPTYEIRRRGSDRPVIVYLTNTGTFDWAFQVPAPKGPSPKTLHTLKAVRAAISL